MKKILATAIVSLTSIGSLSALTPAASAATDTTMRAGSVLRVRMYEHANFGGATYSIYGSGNCTSTTSDTDSRNPTMPSGWNDVVSSWKDYAGCDVKFYADTYYGGAYTYYLNAGSTGRNFGSTWNDRVSSFKVS